MGRPKQQLDLEEYIAEQLRKEAEAARKFIALAIQQALLPKELFDALKLSDKEAITLAEKIKLRQLIH